MTARTPLCRARRGPYSRSRPAASLPANGKCPLIMHTRSDEEERPICLNCPYPRCLLDSAAAAPRPTRRRRQGRPSNPLVAARNTTILQLLARGRTPRDVAARFKLTADYVRVIRNRAGRTAP